jgi:hypothetical protein
MEKQMYNPRRPAVYKLAKIITRDKRSGVKSGSLIPLWKDYDPGRKLKPRYIYYLACSPKRLKGPYLHTRRRGLLTLIGGGATLVYRTKTGFQELRLRADGPEVPMIDIPSGVEYLILNPYKVEARFINICDYPWRKGDSETIIPDFHAYFKKKRRQIRG